MTTSKSSIFLGIASGLSFLLVLFTAIFLIIWLNKGLPLFNSVSISTSVTISFLILAIGACFAFIRYLKHKGK